jgi:hypothetical protein
MSTDTRDESIDNRRILVEIDKMIAEAAKLRAEQAKLNREARYYPFLALGAFFGAAIAFGKLLFGH